MACMLSSAENARLPVIFHIVNTKEILNLTLWYKGAT